jgi:hypothetical protein
MANETINLTRAARAPNKRNALLHMSSMWWAIKSLGSLVSTIGSQCFNLRDKPGREIAESGVLGELPRPLHSGPVP